MVTIKDIAREVGVSPSTVSRALSDSPLISEKTKQNVKEVAQRLGYERNELARGLVKGSSGAVGLVVADITNPFFSDIAQGVGEVAHRFGYGVMLCDTAGKANRESDYIRLLRRKRVDGLILTSATMDDPYLKDLAKTRTPFILVSRLCRSVDAPYVVVDDRVGARLAVEHLINLGHQYIGFIGGPANVQSSRDRMATYREVLQEHGLAEKEEWMGFSDFTQAAGRKAGRQMLSLPERPSAIFAANDMIALGVLEVAEEMGVLIPDDLSLVGYNDISYASLPRVQLTTVAQPTQEMGQIASEWLLSTIEEHKRHPLHCVLNPHLVVRRSTAPPAS
ncbi:LacI family DNA-binding transcriptional regulator [Candidatus Bipolaricaulota bacterium]|jgi:LacI family transcriptional regulator|nr:LacI family DNA-binding transcriptional regulator [Candidatus Bipolaricaulota bacterium]MCK4598986.1 LacI family DNA-binding transcriptional regulator [Candidatus Bipolaricaulota bacterium]MCK4682574.1 LacI family DNA-binding transcriptional regulator [Candidatus Bipolaricaulota bacterium]